MYRAIIFDLDGTLFQTDSVLVDAVNKICVQRGIVPWEREKLMALIGEPMVEICRLVFGSTLTMEEIEEIRSEIRSLQQVHISQQGKLYDHTSEMLDRLREEGYQLCICSNASRQHVEKVLAHFGHREKFKVVKTRIEGLSKAQLIKQIMDELPCSKAIMVGDRLIDIEAAAEAGCLSIGVSYGYGSRESEEADYTAHSAMEVYEIICRLNEEEKNHYENLLKKRNHPGKVSLAAWNPDHVQELRELHKEPEAAEMLGIICLPEDTLQGDKNNIIYSLLDTENQFIGIAELFNISWKNKRAEISLALKPAYRGQGYGYEAVCKLLDIGFGELGFHRIWLRVLEHNHKAIQCYKKAGFVQEGICREESLRKGSFKNQLQMSILRSEWLNRG